MTGAFDFLKRGAALFAAAMLGAAIAGCNEPRPAAPKWRFTRLPDLGHRAPPRNGKRGLRLVRHFRAERIDRSRYTPERLREIRAGKAASGHGVAGRKECDRRWAKANGVAYPWQQAAT